MASLVPFNKAREEVLKGTVHLDTAGDTIKVALMTSAFVPDVDTQNFWSDVSANEAAGTGYVAGGATLANQSVIRDNPLDRAYFDGDDISWPASTITAALVVIYKDTGTPATSPLLAYADLGGNRVSIASEFLIEFDSSGILEN